MKTWLVNSNSNDANDNPNGYRFMLRQNKVAAFFDRRTKIDKIGAGDLVLLYHNNNRVIAAGFVLDSAPHDYAELDAVEHWKDINWIWTANFDTDFNPTNSIDRRELGFDSVRHTVNDISDELNHLALLQAIGQRQSFL